MTVLNVRHVTRKARRAWRRTRN